VLTVAKSNKKSASLKRYPAFPLTPHRHARQWVKKHQEKTRYFGPLGDPDAALDRFNREWKDVIAGRAPESAYTRDGWTVLDLCNAFIVHKRELMENVERSVTSYADHYRTCEMVIDYFGAGKVVDDLRPEDFAAFCRKGATSSRSEARSTADGCSSSGASTWTAGAICSLWYILRSSFCEVDSLCSQRCWRTDVRG
jgi:hypothetical protein